MAAYYNEYDREKAAWLRELIKAGVVAPGEVDERSITDVQPDDLRGFVQCHFFAGIGVWSYALRLAGWPDDRPVWTGSCPCPSFSVAGKGTGFNDPRHLWPAWFALIRECRPGVVFGEQADGAIGHGWLDLVSTDMEAEGYAFAAAVLGAHSVGAPHRRHRLYFVGERADAELPDRRAEYEINSHTYGRNGLGRNGDALGSADTERNGRRPDLTLGGKALSQPEAEGTPVRRESVREYANRIGATRGFWADCDWWYGKDGKYRPIKPGIFPLAHGVAKRVLKLRGAGDAICSETAKVFIEAYQEAVSR